MAYKAEPMTDLIRCRRLFFIHKRDGGSGEHLVPNLITQCVKSGEESAVILSNAGSQPSIDQFKAHTQGLFPIPLPVSSARLR